MSTEEIAGAKSKAVKRPAVGPDECKTILCEKISDTLQSWRQRVQKLQKQHGDFKICDVTVEQIYGGIRGVMIQVSDISYVDPMEGIRIRGYTIRELLEELPKAPGAKFPLAGGLYFLLMANSLPTYEQAMLVEEEWRCRSSVPGYIFDLLDSMPLDTHPMTLFSMAILPLRNESQFTHQYTQGLLQKGEFWEYYLEDSLSLTAKLPTLAAYIYNWKYRGKQHIQPNPDLDWSANFAYMIGKGDDPEYVDLCRLFFLLHSDHEGGNVSAHAAHLVSSALSDVYLASSAGMDGLAGPLHGLANQECLRWLLELRDHFGGLPERNALESYLRSELGSGKVIPGYGHAVLRITDPRFTAQQEYGFSVMPDDELFRLVNLVYEVLPPILKEQGKVKNPWPNVDALNGTMQYHYGVCEFDFYTVLFGISRALGITAHCTWARVVGKPIERPKSLTTQMLEDMVQAAADVREYEISKE